jgi:cell wall-associated NlpC family hydrolase
MLVVAACLGARAQLAAADHHVGSSRHAAVVHHQRVARHRQMVVRRRNLRAARVHARVVRRRSLLARARARVAHERVSVVRFARRFLGVPYVYGGSSPSGGFDCSGFTRYVFAHFGLSLPHYTYGQFDLGHWVPRRALRPGDLVFFYGVGHVGLYIGHDDFIHAPHTGSRVSVASLSSYAAAFVGARRLLH